MPSLLPLSWSVPARTLVGIVLALGVASCQPRQEKPLVHNAPQTIAGRVVVLNADALVIDGRHVHLSNASAPEGVLHARCWAEAMASEKEVEYVKDLVQHALSIDFKPSGVVDSYNRELGLVIIDRMDLGDLLYDRGMAARALEPRFDWCQPISKTADGAPQLSSLINFGS